MLNLEENILLGDSFKKFSDDRQKEILVKYKNKLYWILKEYEQEGFTGLLKYQMKIVKFKEDLKQNMDDKYNIVFEQIRTTIEYDIPKYLSLYQSLFNHACTIKNKVFGNGDLDDVIKFYEIGASNLPELKPLLVLKQLSKPKNKLYLDFFPNSQVMQK